MKIVNFGDVISQLKPQLEDYFNLCGQHKTQNGMFTCIFPDHEDSTPSMSIEDGVRFKCFGCGRSGDIFDAAAILENKSKAGPSFVIDNIAYLASTYNIPVEFGEMSETDKFTYQLQRLYQEVVEIIQATPYNETIKTELDRRKWTEEQARIRGIGTVTSYLDFINALKNNGWDDEFLNTAGVCKSSVFAPSKMIFTIYDKYSQPLCFYARNLSYDKENKNTGTKYDSLHTIDRWTFRKGNHLYGINWVEQKLRKNPSMPVYIVEGHADVIALDINGFAAVATGGSLLSVGHINQLDNIKARRLILCFDGDQPGKDKTDSTITAHFSSPGLFSTKVLMLPDGQDPDSFLRGNSVEAFKALPTITPFEWALNKALENPLYKGDGIDGMFALCEEVIPNIASDPDPLVQGRCVHILAEKTGIQLTWIAQKVKQLVHLHDAEKALRKERVIQDTREALVQNPEDAVEIANRLLQSLQTIDEEDAEEKFGSVECEAALLSLKEAEECKGEGYDGFLMPSFPRMQALLHGDWSTAFTLVGGRPNAGKTGFLCQLSLDIALSNDGEIVDPFGEPSKDTIVVIHSIDDSREKIYNRLLTQLIRSDYRAVSLNMVKNPGHWVSKRGVPESFLDARNRAYGQLSELIRTNRLYVKDSNNGATLSYLNLFLRDLREKHPNKRIFYVFDNLSKVRGTGKREERQIAKTASETVKELTTRYGVSMVCTVEYRKGGDDRRPKDDDIAETIQFQYDADQIIHMHCDLKIAREESPMWWKRTMDCTEVSPDDSDGIIEPVNELIFTKSKITDEEKTIFLDFVRSQAYFKEVSSTYAIQRKRAVKEVMGRMPAAHDESGVPIFFGPGGVLQADKVKEYNKRTPF